MIRYEILFPEHFNDNSVVPHELLEKTRNEIIAQFGACSVDTSQIIGRWKDQKYGKVFNDRLIRVFVDVEDTLENQGWFLHQKEIWKKRFLQEDIWLVSYLITVI